MNAPNIFEQMKHVFLDTNIMLDAVLQRDGGEFANRIFQLGDEGEIILCASCLSYVNIAFILRRHPQEEIYLYERMLREGVDVLPMNVAQLDAALSHPVRDFEDMMQYLCAKAANCDVIVTNNKRDFEEFSDLPVMTAGEFLKSFEEDN